MIQSEARILKISSICLVVAVYSGATAAGAGAAERSLTQQKEYLGVYEMYQPLWENLAPDVRGKVLKGNYERLFDGARERVRAWERANPGSIDTAAAETR